MNENYSVLICALWHHDPNFTPFSFTSPSAKGAKQKEQHLLTFTVFFYFFSPSQLCHLCQTWEWCDQRHLVQVLDWCVEGGALGINKARCQSSIHLCHRRTINKIAFSPTYCWSAGDADRGTWRAWCTDTHWRSAAAGEVIPLLDHRVLNQPHVVFSSLPADGELMPPPSRYFFLIA